MWCDIGCCRNGPEEMKQLSTFPNIKTIKEKLPRNKMCLFAINSFTLEEKTEAEQIVKEAQGNPHHLILPKKLQNIPTITRDIIIPTIMGPYPHDRIQGTAFLGDRQAWAKWIFLYRFHLKQFCEKGWFGGKDQNIMTALCLWYKDLVHVVAVPHVNWFWFRDYLK